MAMLTAWWANGAQRRVSALLAFGSLMGGLGVAATAKASEMVVSMAGESPCVAVYLDITENGKSLGAFSVQSSGIVKRGADFATLPAIVSGRTYEFSASCVSTTKFTQTQSLKFKASGKPLNLVFRATGFTLRVGP